MDGLIRKRSLLARWLRVPLLTVRHNRVGLSWWVALKCALVIVK